MYPHFIRRMGLGKDHAEWNSVDCLYFSLSVDDLPSDEPILYLDGTGNGPINNLTFVSTLCDCAPVGQALASVSVIGKKEWDIEEIANQAKNQLAEWFGKKSGGLEIFKRISNPSSRSFLSHAAKPETSIHRSLPVRRLFRTAFH